MKVGSLIFKKHCFTNEHWIHKVTFSIARVLVRINFHRRPDPPGVFLGIGIAGRN